MIIINEKKPVQCIVRFKKPLFYNEILSLLNKATSEYNAISEKNRKELRFFKRLVTRRDVYLVHCDHFTYGSYDGRVPMKRLAIGMYDPLDYPEAKYEKRYIIYLLGIRDIHLYFNIIPGFAKDDQFATEIGENESVSCITIKANIKSNMRWKLKQAKFLEKLVPIIEKLHPEVKK